MSASEEDVYEVEAILHHRARRGRGADVLEYEIKWVGYSEDDNTWERESNINAGDLLQSYWEQLGGEKAHQEAIEKARGSSKAGAKAKKRGRRAKQESPGATEKPTKATAHSEETRIEQRELASPANGTSPEQEVVPTEKEDTEEYAEAIEAASESEAVIEGHASPILGLPEEDMEDSDFDSEIEAIEKSTAVTTSETTSPTETKSTLSTARFRAAHEKRVSPSEPELRAKRARKVIDSDEDEEQDLLKTTDQDKTKESPAYMTYPTNKKSSRLEDTFETKKLAKIGTQDVIFDANWPPASMSWEKDAVSVEYVVKEPSVTELKDVNSLYAVVKWRSGLISMHPCSLVREKCPNQLIAFYESRLMFRN